MHKRIFLFISLLLVLFMTTQGMAQSTISAPRVLILPFVVHGDAQYQYLQTEVPSVIARELTEEGATIVSSGMTTMSEKPGVAQARSLAAEKGADYVVWGSVTPLGNRISVDMTVMGRHQEARSFYGEALGAEQLAGVVGDLTHQVSAQIFSKQTIANVTVMGAQRVDADSVLAKIQSASGKPYSRKVASDDLKTIYGMGYFDDIRVEATPVAGTSQVNLTFYLTEKPTLRNIRFKGNSKTFKDGELQENMTLRTGAVLNVFTLQQNISRIETMYKEKNYHNVSVSYKLIPVEDRNQVDLEVTIVEGGRVRVKEIRFEGNKTFTDKQIRKLMRTKESSMFSFVTEAGSLKPDELDQDMANIETFYTTKGYVNAKVADPDIRFEEDGIFVTVKIEEGEQYTVGNVTITGDEVIPFGTMLTRINLKPGAPFDRNMIRNDILTLKDIAGDEGFANAQVAPNVGNPTPERVVDVSYEIRKGNPVYFDRIEVTGNTSTRDKVIRRELRIYEGELFRGTDLKRSIQNLQRLDYFEDVQVEQLPSDKEDHVTLGIEVKEKPTGSFSFGGGYSTEDGPYVAGSVSKRNFLGKGQTIEFDGLVGTKTTRFTLRFIEPYLLDSDVSMDTELYNWVYDYDEYKKSSWGGALTFGYPLMDYLRLYVGYQFEYSDITEVVDWADPGIRDMKGTHITSAVFGKLRYDSRDRFFNATRGIDANLSIKYAGLGGDIKFTKYTGEAAVYVPLFWGTVGYAHIKAGYLQEAGSVIPDWERFYLGGLNSLRGFGWRDVSPKNAYGERIGGTKMIQYNLEYHFPVLPSSGLIGLVFFDMGNVFANDQSYDPFDLRYSAGYGIRWFSPIGPIRIECGYILDPKDGESSSGRWEFGMGQTF